MSADSGNTEMWTLPDYSDVRLRLVRRLLEQEASEEDLGFIGAAAVTLHAAIDEWVTGNLITDTHQYCQRYGKPYQRLWREWDPKRRTLEWKIERLALVNSGDHWGLAYGTPEVRAIQGLNQHRNRLVHMDMHVVRITLLGEPPEPPSDNPHMYELARIRTPVTVVHFDGSKRTIDQTHVIVDPWRRLDPAVVGAGLGAFEEMRAQYWGAHGEDVGTLEFPSGPIWEPRPS